MEFLSLGIEGSWVAKAPIWSDSRGSFREWFKSHELVKITGNHFDVRQANTSKSEKGTVRGIHYSLHPSGQAKWITCITGSIMDVIVDIRPNSSTYGNWTSIEISAESGLAVLVGEGLGHAFQSLEDSTTVSYLLSSEYSPHHEFEINPLDPEIGIIWKNLGIEMIVSSKDASAPSLSERFAEKRLPFSREVRHKDF
jgi:dTDP-4-dehydrorhamnose 3,5-epimerase